jgi:hypothetical protein
MTRSNPAVTTAFRPLALATLLLLAAGPALAQQADRWSRTLAAGSLVRLNNVTGDVVVTGASGGAVEIVGRPSRGAARDEFTLKVVETRDGIVACVLRRDSEDECDERGLRSRGNRRRDWGDRGSMALEVRLPRGLNVAASSVSGDVTVSGTEGETKATTVSGDVRVERVRAPMLKATSVSGDVTARIDALTGDGAIEVTSVSGDVELELPKALDADVELRTVSGDLDTDFPIALQGRVSTRRLEGRIGKGGRRLEVTTVSGDVRIRAR